MIHAGKIDENFSQQEEMIIKKALLKMGANTENIQEIIEQSKVIELINGMQEIKLHNAERRMRWNWEYVQARLFKVATKSLALEQTQSVGSNFINELKNMFVTILSAKLVIDGDITLGMMMAISYIVGQLNGPIVQLIDFMRDVQDAQISIDRLGEIHNMEDEEKPRRSKRRGRYRPSPRRKKVQGAAGPGEEN